jgi:hypothetical protein
MIAGGKSNRNPKFEARNPKQAPMFKIQMSQTEKSLEFRHLNFGFVWDLDIRI